MSINQILANSPSQTLKWLEEAAGRQFSELIQEWLENELRKLQTEEHPAEFFKAQGAVKYLKQIIELPETIRSYQHDIASGKRKKVEDAPVA